MSKKIVSIFLLMSLVVSNLLYTNINIVEAQTNENLVEVVSSEASSFCAEGNNAAKAFDHNSDTRWTSDLGLNDGNRNKQYLIATFNKEVDLSRVEITWFTPWINEYKVEVSTDGTSWSEAAVSSVTTNGTEIDKEGAESLKQKVTRDELSGVAAKYLKISMTDVSSSYTYLSIVDVDIYSYSTIDIKDVTLCNIGSYDRNVETNMIDGTTDSAANRWTSDNLSMSVEAVKNASIIFTFEKAMDITRFEVDWFNTPVTKYSLSVSDSDDGAFTKVIDSKTMPVADKNIGGYGDKMTHTSDAFVSNTRAKRVLLSFDDANPNGYLSICEVRAYGKTAKDPWEINLVGNDATATASSIQGNLVPSQAIDGDKSTRWASAFYEQPSWLLIDLKDNVSFDQMKIYQEASYAKSFNVEVSTNNEVYTRIYETSKGQEGTNNIYFGDEINARYVKINFTEYGYYPAYSIWEVELFKNGADRMFEFVANELSVPSKISSNFKLPTTIQNMKINWETTSDLLNIDANGNVSVTTPESNTNVEIVAKLKYGDQDKTIRFNSTVLNKDNRQVNYEIYPVPQKMTLGDSNVNLTETINVVLSDKLKNELSLKNRIKEVFEENGYKIEYKDQMDAEGSHLLIGVNGDGSVADTYATTNSISKNVFQSTEEKRYDKHIVSLDENKNIVVLAQDADSAYYGLATLDLMFETAQSSAYFGFNSKRMTTVFIEDYADMQYRGVIEGFYGWPWSLEDRLSYVEFAKRYKLNYYAYGPKSDPYHLSKWNEEYPTNATITEEEKKLEVMTQEDFRNLVTQCNESHINFVWSIHPAMGDQKIDFSSKTSITNGITNIMKKYDSMYDLGVRQFGLFVDDIDLNVAYNAKDDIADMVDTIQKQLYSKYGRAYDDLSNGAAVKSLMFVPSYYFLTFGDSTKNKESIEALSSVHDDVIITFTGDGCWSSVKESDAKTFAQRAGRDPLFWWNYSTNDIMDDQLFTDKVDSYYSMNKDVKSLYGFVSNPMNEAELSKISLFGIADYAWNVQDFDSSRDYDAYFRIDFEDQSLAQAYKNVAINLDKNGKSLSSEKALFNKILNNFINGQTVQQEDIDKLKTYAQNLQESLEKMKEFKTSDKNEYQNLYDEMLPWLNKLTEMSRMALELCDYLENPTDENEWSLYANQLLQLDAFENDENYAFVSLELNVSNAQSSYLTNLVKPNQPLHNFIKGMNNALKTELEKTKTSSEAEFITNLDDSKGITLSQNIDLTLNLDGIKLSQNEYVGIAFHKIWKMNIDVDHLKALGLDVEYSLNGKEWTNSADEFAYIRFINKESDVKNITDSFEVKNIKTIDQSITTNMSHYDTYTIDKVIDGDFSTKFWKNNNQAQGDYVQIQYDQKIKLNDLGIYFDSVEGNLTDAPQKAYVQVSNDGSSWETIKEMNIADIQRNEKGMYYVSVDGSNREVQYVRYYVETPSSGQWFRLVEIVTNEKVEKPVEIAKAMVDNQPLENVSDGNVTTYSQLLDDKEMIYQVTDNIHVEKINILGIPNLNKEINAKVSVYASKTCYPFTNEWIDLGAIDDDTTQVDVSQLYNLQKIKITSEEGDFNIFEIQLKGNKYIDNPELKDILKQANNKLKELASINLNLYTATSANAFEQSIIELRNRLSTCETIEEADEILAELETCHEVLVRKGDFTKLRKLYDKAVKLDSKKYTQDSYKILSDTLKEVEELFNNNHDVDQQQVDNMITKLNKAIQNLQSQSTITVDDEQDHTNTETSDSMMLGSYALLGLVSLAGVVLAMKKRKHS